MIQIPVLSIAEADGVFTLQGPNGMAETISADALNDELASMMSNYAIALSIARCRWWAGRAAAVDKAAYDAAHCELITWNPTAEQAVTYAPLD
jgi:hypothetical protein